MVVDNGFILQRVNYLFSDGIFKTSQGKSCFKPLVMRVPGISLRIQVKTYIILFVQTV